VATLCRNTQERGFSSRADVRACGQQSLHDGRAAALNRQLEHRAAVGVLPAGVCSGVEQHPHRRIVASERGQREGCPASFASAVDLWCASLQLPAQQQAQQRRVAVLGRPEQRGGVCRPRAVGAVAQLPAAAGQAGHVYLLQALGHGMGQQGGR
jgi:hypothetical protein